jgi:hypothetical protein
MLIKCRKCGGEFCRPNPVGQTPKYCLACKRTVRKDISRRYAQKNPESVKASNLAWRTANKEQHNRYNREYSARKHRENSSFHVGILLRNRFRDALKNNRKIGSAIELLDMSLKEFQIYIRGQFRPGMNWENYGPVWHLDHVRPCASFDLADPEQQKICFRWDNYQPLFAKENLKKGAKCGLG